MCRENQCEMILRSKCRITVLNYRFFDYTTSISAAVSKEIELEQVRNRFEFRRRAIEFRSAVQSL